MTQRRNDDMQQSGGKRGDDLHIKLSDKVPFVGGSEFTASGRNMVYLLITLGAVGLGVAHHITASDEHKSILELGERIVKAVNLNTYVVALPDAKRLLLDLAEPKEIRELRELREWQRNMNGERK